MGSLSLATAIGGAGTGMVANVERESLREEKDLDRMHQERLTEMRNTAAMERQTASQEFVTGQAKTLREQQLEDLGEEREYQAGLATGAAAREDVIREDEQEHAIDIQAMKQWQEQTESASYTSKDGKWEMKVLTQGEIGPNGLPVETDTFVVREPGTPFSYVQHGLTMLPHNYTDEEQAKALSIANSGDEQLQNAKADLMSKAGTDRDDSSMFMDAYGFLPAAYFRKIRKSEEGAGGAYQQFRQSFRRPAPSLPPLGTRQPGIDDTANLLPGVEDPLAIEYQKVAGKPLPPNLTEAQRAQLEDFLQARRSPGILSQAASGMP